jgi:hypothetical protein
VALKGKTSEIRLWAPPPAREDGGAPDGAAVRTRVLREPSA